MLQSFTNSLLFGQGVQTSHSAGMRGSANEVDGAFPDVFVGILRDLDVLQETLSVQMSEEGTLSLDEILSQHGEALSEALPPGGNVLPPDVTEADILQALSLMMAQGAAQQGGEEISDELSAQMLGLQRGGSAREPLTLSQLENLRHMIQAQLPKEAAVASSMTDKSSSGLQMFDHLLGQRIQQLAGEQAALSSGGKELKNFGDVFKGNASLLQGVMPNTSSFAMSSERPMVAQTSALPQTVIQTPVGQPGWDQELGDRCVYLQ